MHYTNIIWKHVEKASRPTVLLSNIFFAIKIIYFYRFFVTIFEITPIQKTILEYWMELT